MENVIVKLQKVMVVDDAELDRQIAKKTITKIGFAEEVITAESAMDALDHLRSCPDEVPSLIFLDINMPEMSGFDFLEEYAALEVKSKCIIVMLSSSMHREDQERAENSPYVCRFLNKPLTAAKLGQLDECFK
jgi:CheY-like chemotaxis protein